MPQSLRPQRGRKFLAENFEHGRAHDAANHSHRDHRQGNDRQDQVARFVPVRRNAAATAHPGRRQHRVEHCEDDDECDAQPVMWHADPKDRDHRKQLVEQTAVVKRAKGSQVVANEKPSKRAGVARTKVLPSALSNSPVTRNPVNTDVPRLPCSTRPSQARYWMYNGLSKPNSTFSLSTTSFGASGGSRISSGLPGIRWIRPNATIETPNRIRIVCNSRSAMNRAMRSLGVWAGTPTAIGVPASGPANSPPCRTDGTGATTRAMPSFVETAAPHQPIPYRSG